MGVLDSSTHTIRHVRTSEGTIIIISSAAQDITPTSSTANWTTVTAGGTVAYDRRFRTARTPDLFPRPRRVRIEGSPPAVDPWIPREFRAEQPVAWPAMLRRFRGNV